MEGILRWFSWRLPRQLVYFCLIRAWAYATSGEFGITDVPRVSMSRVVKRWETKGE